MNRFQRTKYLSRLSDVRRELATWIAVYRSISSPGTDKTYTSREIEVAESRQYWLEDIVDSIEAIEEALSDGPMYS